MLIEQHYGCTGAIQPFQTERLLRMSDEISYRWIERRHAAQVLLNTLLIEIDVDKCGQARIFRSVEHPKARGLASREVRQHLERRRPQGLVQGCVVKRLNR